MVYAYIRVSTDTQTVENQRYEIDTYCKKNNLIIDKYIEETISGTKEYNKRRLGVLLKILDKNDILIASELSRLGRSFYMIMEILNICMTKGVKVITIKDNFILGDNIESKVIAFAFSLSAEIERQLISQRTKEALTRLRKQGKKLGRPKGSKNKHLKTDQFKAKIEIYLNKGLSCNQIAKKIGVHKNTIYKMPQYKENKNGKYAKNRPA